MRGSSAGTTRLLGPGAAPVALALVLAACEDLLPPGEVPALGTLERDRIELVADSAEPVTELALEEGERVAVGDVIVVQESRLHRTRLARARADLAAARARHEEAIAGPRMQEIDEARQRLAAARTAEQTALAELERSRALAARQLVSPNTLDVQQGRYEEAVARRQQAQAVLDLLLAGTRSERIRELASALEAARAQVEEIELTVERATVRASRAGTVEALPFEIGERPRPGATVAVILADGRTYARVHVPQRVRNALTPGAAADIRIDGYASAFRGRLRWIADDPSFTPFFALTRHDRGELSYLAEVDLLEAEASRLPAGVAVEVRFPDLQ